MPLSAANLDNGSAGRCSLSVKSDREEFSSLSLAVQHLTATLSVATVTTHLWCVLCVWLEVWQSEGGRGQLEFSSADKEAAVRPARQSSSCFSRWMRHTPCIHAYHPDLYMI